MEIEKWIERGVDSFEANQWFDGIQYMKGALQRSFQSGEIKKVEMIYQVASELLLTANKRKLFCQLVMDSFPYLRKKIHDKKWIVIYPLIMSILNKEGINSCISDFINHLVDDKGFQDEIFIQELHTLILRDDIPKETKSNLYFCTAGLLCYQREYVKCFEMLSEWNKLIPSSPKILTYLAVAELNAFEVEGVSGYITQAKSIIDQSSIELASEYVDIGSQLFKAVELENYELLQTIIADFGEIIDIKHDALLNALCNGLIDFLKPKSKNMSSLFR